jgi:hypothetical protein
VFSILSEFSGLPKEKGKLTAGGDKQHREAMQRQQEWARQQHEYMQGFFAQQRQLQVLCKFNIFSSPCALFTAIRYLIYYRFLENVSDYIRITI